MTPLEEVQGCLRQNKYALNQVFTHKTIIKEQIHRKQPCYHAFSDIKKFTKCGLWRKHKNIARRKFKILKSMFDYTEVAMRTNGKETQEVKTGVGILQELLL